MRNSVACFFLLLCGITVAHEAHASVRIYDAEEVKRWFVTKKGAKKKLRVDGREWDLVTDPNSTLVSSLGDGSFHPMNPDWVREAVDELPLGDRVGQILILPFPRERTLRSSFENGIVFLSPGIRAVSRAHVHMTVVHELGHYVQYSLAPDGSRPWNEYLQLRGITDTERFHKDAIHADRPHEIFAEDFRDLFGGSFATASGSIENPDLVRPDQVPGLRAWFEALLETPEVSVRGLAAPNPLPASRGALATIRFSGTAPVGDGMIGDVFNVRGQRVQSFRGWQAATDAVEFRWDGRTFQGQLAAPGLYVVRWRETGASARIVVR